MDVWKSGNVIFPSFPSLRLPLGMFLFVRQKEHAKSITKSSHQSKTVFRIQGWLAVQQVDDGVGVGAGKTVSKDRDTAVGFDGDITEQ